MTQRGYVLIFAALVAIGLGARVLRYGAASDNRQAQNEALVAAFLEARGWRAGERLPLTADFTYSATPYQREGCRDPFFVSIVGGGADAAGLYSRTGRPWVFIRKGVASASPPTWGVMIDAALSGVRGKPLAPMLAIYAPGNANGPCAGPSLEDWATLGAAG